MPPRSLAPGRGRPPRPRGSRLAFACAHVRGAHRPRPSARARVERPSAPTQCHRRPYGAQLPGSARVSAGIFGRAFDVRPMEGPHLGSTAMYHGGCYSFYVGALNVGHGLVIMDRFDPEEALRLIERRRVTTAYMVPTQFHRLLRLPADVK